MRENLTTLRAPVLRAALSQVPTGVFVKLDAIDDDPDLGPCFVVSLSARSQDLEPFAVAVEREVSRRLHLVPLPEMGEAGMTGDGWSELDVWLSVPAEKKS